VISQRVQAAAVVLFVLTITGVVVVLLERADREAPAAPSPSAQPGDVPGSDEGPVGRLVLAAGTGDLVVRYRSGSCKSPGGPKLELSKNQGRTFRDLRVPQVGEGTGVGVSSPAIQAIVATTATSATQVTVTGADEKCDVAHYVTDDGGQTWTQEKRAVEEWYIDPLNDEVVSPTGPTDPQCKKVGVLAPVSATAAKVFCAGGAIRSTNDGGAVWTKVGQLEDVAGAVFTSPLIGYAEVSEPSCDSRIQATADGGATWVPKGCILSDQLLPGFAGTKARLVAGGPRGTRISTDDGATWEPPTME
jgi:photosystem II stability/assembly factor-like uncharacterized protein